jgi:UDP-N-acetylmuramoylalanine--D-glutamate ligase
VTRPLEPVAGAPLVAGARVGVLGLGRSGSAAARLLARAGAAVYASDAGAGASVTTAAAALAAEGIDAEAGRHDLDRLAGCDMIVPSPGIPPTAAVLADPRVAARPIVSEIEVASWFARAPIAAVTGTNGKTTTTELLGHVVRASGRRASVAGNVGRAFSAAILDEPDVEWHVLEVSSFQLARIDRFRPRVAVVLNLTPDHLDVYPDMDAYARDKRRIAENQTESDHLCLNAEDPALGALYEGVGSARRHAFDRGRAVRRGAWIEEGWIALAAEPVEGRVLPVERLRIPGAHNVQNALAATLAAALVGVEREAIAEGLASFDGVPHRLQTILEEDGVRWVNDSKATNVDSAVVALEAFDAPLVVILGGRHKGSPYAPLAPLLTRARAVLAIGEAAPRIAQELSGAAVVEIVGTLERAVERARELAGPGDVVLLSPACSSYDQFTDYVQRGERFRELVTSTRSTRPAGLGAGR